MRCCKGTGSICANSARRRPVFSGGNTEVLSVFAKGLPRRVAKELHPGKARPFQFFPQRGFGENLVPDVIALASALCNDDVLFQRIRRLSIVAIAAQAEIGRIRPEPRFLIQEILFFLKRFRVSARQRVQNQNSVGLERPMDFFQQYAPCLGTEYAEIAIDERDYVKRAVKIHRKVILAAVCNACARLRRALLGEGDGTAGNVDPGYAEAQRAESLRIQPRPAAQIQQARPLLYLAILGNPLCGSLHKGCVPRCGIEI